MQPFVSVISSFCPIFSSTCWHSVWSLNENIYSPDYCWISKNQIQINRSTIFLRR